MTHEFEWWPPIWSEGQTRRATVHLPDGKEYRLTHEIYLEKAGLPAPYGVYVRKPQHRSDWTFLQYCEDEIGLRCLLLSIARG